MPQTGQTEGPPISENVEGTNLTDNKELTKSYVCQYSNISYRGACPVQTCPANIDSKKHSSGCFHLAFPDKPKLTEYELSWAFSEPTRSVKKHIERGIENIMEVLRLDRALELINNKVNETPHKHCSRCGVVRTGAGNCLMASKCNSRQRVVSKVLQRYPTNIRVLGFEARHLWLILKYEQTVCGSLSRENHEEINLQRLLRLDDEKVEIIREHNYQV